MKYVRWGSVLLGGFVAEIIIFGIAIPIAILLGEESILYTAAPASLVATFICGWWIAAKKATHQQVLHGLLVGAVAMIIYIAMSLGRPEPLTSLRHRACTQTCWGCRWRVCELAEHPLIRSQLDINGDLRD